MRDATLSAALFWLCLSVRLVTFTAAAHAQHPLCPPPSPEDTYYYSCRPGSTNQVAGFLYDFTVRHLFKSQNTFEIPVDKLFAVLDLQKFFDPGNADVQALLADRPSVTFTPLDRSTGEFLIKGTGSANSLSISNSKLGISLELSVPEVVQGLYWRSPANLELQFYRGHNIRFHLFGTNVTEYEEGLQCVSISAGRTRVTTSDSLHRYLLSLYEQCP